MARPAPQPAAKGPGAAGDAGGLPSCPELVGVKNHGKMMVLLWENCGFTMVYDGITMEYDGFTMENDG